MVDAASFLPSAINMYRNIALNVPVSICEWTVVIKFAQITLENFCASAGLHEMYTLQPYMSDSVLNIILKKTLSDFSRP